MNANSLLDFSDYVTGKQALEEASQAIRSLKKDVTSFSKAVDQDGDRIKQGLEKVAAAIKEIRDKGGNLNLVNESDRASLRELIKQVAGLTAEQNKLKTAQEGAAAAQKNVREAAGLYTKELSEQRKALVEARKANDVEAQKKAALAIQGLAAQQKEFSKAVRGTASELTAAAGSYNAANQELIRLRAEYKALGGALDGTNPKATELANRIQQLDTQLKSSDKTLGQAYRNVGNYTQSILDAVRALEQEKSTLLAASGALKAQATATGLTADQQQRLQEEIKQTDAALDKVNDGLKGYGVSIDDANSKNETFAGGLKKYALTLGLAVFSFEALGQAAQTVFRNNVEFSDSLADVQKTTGLTADEADRLAESLKAIPTRTSLSGLLDIAKIGGQIGIAKADILDFTKSVDVAAQALVDDYGGNIEQLATELGKIGGVFRKELGPDVAQNITAIGSAVNEIGAEGAATAPFLTDVALRVGAVAAASGVGLKNVFAYAAVLEETGFSAERSGTSLNRLFSTLSTKTRESFEIARKANPALTFKEFNRLVNTDFNAAIQAFLKGLNAGGKSTTQLNELLGTLKLQSGEAKNVIITLAQNTDLFAQRQATANTQLREATSLAEEARIKNDNLAGSTSKLTNEYSNFFTSGVGARVLKFVVDLTRESGGLALVSGALTSLGQGINFVKEKTGLAKKEQTDFTAATVTATLALDKQAAANQKLLDSYVALRDTRERSAAQELEFTRLAGKLQADFGTKDARAIQANIDLNKTKALSNRQGLESELNYYDKEFLPGLQRTAAKAQQAVNNITLSPADLERYRKIAQSRLEGEVNGIRVEGRSTVDDKKIKILQDQLIAEQRLARETERRAKLAAALGKVGLSDGKAKKAALDEEGDAEEEATGRFDKAAKARAAARKQDLENQLAAQQRLIEETKRFVAEQGRLFEEGQITSEALGQATGGSGDKLRQAERESARIRIEIARAAKDEAVAQADEELNAVLRKRKVSQAEIEDAQAAHYYTLRATTLKFKSEVLKINSDLALELEKNPAVLDFKVVGIDPAALAKGQQDIDRANQLALDRMQRDTDARKEKYEKDAQNAIEAEERKRRFREQAIDLAVQAEQAFFDYQAQRNYAAIQNLEENYQLGLAALGDNEEAKARLTEEYNERSRAAKRKAAKDDKTAALFQVAINTALAVAKTFAEFGFPLGIPFAALAVGAGAIQAAAIAAQPIPAYFKGRESGPAEFAEVAERGPELIEGKKGFRLAEKRGVTFLQAGDKVHTAQKTREMLRASETGMTQPLQFSVSLRTVERSLNTTAARAAQLDYERAAADSADKIVRAIERMPGFKLNITDQGIEKIFESKNNLTTRLNQKLKQLGRP